MVEGRLDRNLMPRVERATHVFRVVYIGSFLEIQKLPPFDGSGCDGEIHAVVDFDGVIPEGDCLKDTANLRTLSKIGEKSKAVDIHTSRIFCDDSDPQKFNLSSFLGNQFTPISDFPLLTWSSEFFLDEIIKMRNDGCRVNFVTGLQKIVGGNKKIMDLSGEVLSSGNTLVMIGSSSIDAMVSRSVYRNNRTSIINGNNFFCYNTGHILI